jgi:hypothetical protein
MKHDDTRHDFLENDWLDRELSASETLLPSSGFASSVMEAVRSEAAVPPPIPFPWKRAVPGLVALFVCLSWLGFKLARTNWAPADPSQSAWISHAWDTAIQLQAGWIALVLLVTLLSLKLAFVLGRVGSSNA